MRNIKLVLEYDGAPYFGFQRQPRHKTVQEALEKALSGLLNRPVKITAASGRTDTGVHARGQVVNFKTDAPMDGLSLRKGLNALLPRDIAVLSVEEVPASFHARYSARQKTYEYQIWNQAVRSPLRASRAFHVTGPLNLARMRSAARKLIGRHDFRSFCAADPSGKERENTVRTLSRFEVLKKGPLLRVVVTGDGFLYKMVRNLVGTLLEIGSGKMSLEDLDTILKARDRRKAGKTAPAHGLTLISVDYEV